MISLPSNAPVFPGWCHAGKLRGEPLVFNPSKVISAPEAVDLGAPVQEIVPLVRRRHGRQIAQEHVITALAQKHVGALVAHEDVIVGAAIQDMISKGSVWVCFPHSISPSISSSKSESCFFLRACRIAYLFH